MEKRFQITELAYDVGHRFKFFKRTHTRTGHGFTIRHRHNHDTKQKPRNTLCNRNDTNELHADEPASLSKPFVAVQMLDVRAQVVACMSKHQQQSLVCSSSSNILSNKPSWSYPEVFLSRQRKNQSLPNFYVTWAWAQLPASVNKPPNRQPGKVYKRDCCAIWITASVKNREKLKVPPRPFPLEEHSHDKHSGQLQVFFTQLEPNSHGARQSSHASVETNSNKRISVLGTNHTKIYRVNLVGFKHSAEDPSRSPHHQNKYTLRSKRFSNVLSKHQGRFPETVPEAKHSQTEVPITSD